MAAMQSSFFSERRYPETGEEGLNLNHVRIRTPDLLMENN
jgi:hypothetical protein